MLKTTKTNTEASFEVKVQPGAGKNEIVQVCEDVFRIRINAPPVKRKVNKKK